MMSLTFGLFTQVSGSGPLGPLVLFFHLIMYSNLTTMEFCRPRSFCDLGQRSHISCLSIFSKGFVSETRPISLKFPMQPSGKGRTEVYIFHPGHMTKMAVMPICGKNLKKKLLLLHHWVDYFETWYVASGELVLFNLYNDGPWLSLPH